MSKKLKIFLITISILFVGYSVVWFVVMNKVADDINKQYANKSIEPKINHQEKDEQGESNFSLSWDSKFDFTKVKPTGFPFKWALAVKGIYSTHQKEKTEFQSPLIIGYNLLSQNIFIKYTGDIIIKNNNIITGRIEDIVSESTFRLGTYSLIKTLLRDNDKFELINHLGLVTLNIKNLKWYNEAKTEKYYDLDHATVELTFDKPFYYLKPSDFFDHPPHNGSFYHSMKFNENQSMPVPQELKEFSDVLQKPVSVKMNVNFKNEDKTEINLLELRYEVPSLTKSFVSGSLKNDKKGGFKVDLVSEDEIGKNYFEFLRILFNSKEISHIINADPALQELQFILNHPKNFYLNQFENRKYDLTLKAQSWKKNGQEQVKIENFNLSSGRTSIQVKSDAEFGSNDFKAKGTLFAQNFPKLVDISSGYILRYFKLFQWSDDAQAIVANLGKDLLRTISDHPESKSNDLSLTYDINSNNLMQSKIGNVQLAQIENLYYLALYKAAGNKIRLDDKAMEKLGKIIPDFGEQIKKINPDSVKEIIKEPQKIFNKNILNQLIK